MATHARGLVCLALTEEKLRALGIPLVAGEGSARRTFGVSIEAKRGVSTGISAADRATTILAAVGENATPEDLVMTREVGIEKALVEALEDEVASHGRLVPVTTRDGDAELTGSVREYNSRPVSFSSRDEALQYQISMASPYLARSVGFSAAIS